MNIGWFFNHTFTSKRLSRVADGAGGRTETLAPHIMVPQPCAVRPADRREKIEMIGDRQQATVTHVLYTYATVDIKRDDEVTLSNGLKGRVDAINDPGGRGEHYEITLEAVQRGR